MVVLWGKFSSWHCYFYQFITVHEGFVIYAVLVFSLACFYEDVV